jgi:DNA-binding transcriptional ArsR family regulator
MSPQASAVRSRSTPPKTAAPPAKVAAGPTRAAALKAGSVKQLAPFFAALGDETRLKLVSSLCAGGPRSIAQLTADTDLSRQAVTKHLRVLANAGLARDSKCGRERLWEFESARLDKARRSLDLIAAQWDHALSRLKSVLEEGSHATRS